MLQIEYDLRQLARKIRQEKFDASGGQKMFEYKFKVVETEKNERLSNQKKTKVVGNDIV